MNPLSDISPILRSCEFGRGFLQCLVGSQAAGHATGCEAADPVGPYPWPLREAVAREHWVHF